MSEQDSFIIDDPENLIFRLNRRTLSDPSILDEERRKVFDRSWIYCGHASEIPNVGDFETRNVCGRPVIFCRDEDNKVRVFLNSLCSSGAQVCRERFGNARRFYCFYHGWTYGCDGRLKTVPARDSYPPNFNKERLSLREPPRVEGYRDFWFISFDSEIISLDEYLGDAKDYIDLVVEQSPWPNGSCRGHPRVRYQGKLEATREERL